MNGTIQYYQGQFESIGSIFDRAIHEKASSHYSPEQIAAWAPRPIDWDFWRSRCELKRPFCYVEGETVIGFLELDPDGHIDCHYVDPDFQRRGVGAALLKHAIAVCQQNALSQMRVEASHLARGLYTKFGFSVIRENVAHRHGVALENWIMQRDLR